MWFMPISFLLPLTSIANCWTRLRDRGRPRGRVHTLEGVEYYQAAKKHGLWISMRLSGDYHFRVRRENALHRLLKRIRLVGEWQSGERRFDNACYVISDDREVGRLLRDEALVKVLRHLVAEPARASDFAPFELRIYPTVVTLVYRKVIFFGRPSAYGESKRAVPLLAALIEHLERLAPASDSPRRDPTRKAMYALVAPAVPLLLTGGAMMVVERYRFAPKLLDVWALAGDLIAPAAVTMVAWVLATCVLLRGSSRLSLALTEIVLVGTLGVVLAGTQLAIKYNIEFDGTEPVAIRTQVIGKSFDRGGRRSPDRYFINAAPERVGPIDVRVAPSLYKAIAPGDRVEILLREGALGYQWIESLQRVRG